MNGLQIQYLLGLYFIIVSISWSNNTIVADAFKLVAGVVLLVLAVFGLTLLH